MFKLIPIKIRAAMAPILASAPLWAGPVEDLSAWLKLDRGSRPPIESQAFASAPLTAAEAEQARTLVWAERLAFVKAQWGAQWSGKRLVEGSLQMRFDYRVRGAKPAAGYDLYISMHGGGSAPAATNDQQWQNQIVLYQPPGIYLAPRAPTDAWNMWHKEHIDPFFDRIIQLAVALQDANPDRVYVMGYSAGGDGAYHMTPRMADRWAAGAMMAGYPNSASPVNLRNIGMTLHVGALDDAYDRNTMVVDFGRQIQKLQDADPGFYKYQVKVHAGKGHWMDLEDAEALPWMQAFTRNPHPKKIVWLQDTTVGSISSSSSGAPVREFRPQWQFGWVARPDRKDIPYQGAITAEIRGQEVHILATNLDSVLVWLTDRLLDLDKPVAFFWKGAKVHEGKVSRTAANLYRSLDGRGDRELVFSARMVVGKDGLGVGTAPPAVEVPFHLRLEKEAIRIERAGGGGEGWALLADPAGRVLARGDFRGRSALSLPLGGREPGIRILTVHTVGRTMTRKILVR